MRAFATFVLLTTTFAATSLNLSSAMGQIKDFPYEARVVADEAFVRSGAGDAYYPTQKVARDSVVTVHRHDPGGWYMIDPPKGSFSWIPERFVRRVSDTEGEVREENVIAFVGSEFGDEISVFQRRLKTGEKVTILGQRQIDTTSGVQNMLQIAPPMRERRWIPGSAVVPVDDKLRALVNSDPYKVPGNAKRPEGPIVSPSQMDSKASIGGNGVTAVPPIGPSEHLVHLQEIRREQQRLAEVDSRFREMILRDVSTWDLDAIENEYRTLQETSSHKPVSGQIDMRYPAIERYRRRLANLMELKQLTSQTEMRDSELLARHTSSPGFQGRPIASAGPLSMQPPGQPTQLTEAFESYVNKDVSNIAAVDETAAGEVPQNFEDFALNEHSGGVPPGLEASTADATSAGATSFESGNLEAASFAPGNSSTTSAEGSAASGVIIPGSPQNRYIGAGIVQKVADPKAGAAYVLMAPSGKILADLKPTGNVQLDQFVGQQVGISGSRWSEKEKRDIIEVSALETVRIRQ